MKDEHGFLFYFITLTKTSHSRQQPLMVSSLYKLKEVGTAGKQFLLSKWICYITSKKAFNTLMDASFNLKQTSELN